MTDTHPEKLVSLMDFLAYSALLESQLPPDMKRKLDNWGEILAEKAGDAAANADVEILTDGKMGAYLRESELRKLFNGVAGVKEVPQVARDVLQKMIDRVIETVPDHSHKLPGLKPV